MEIILKLNAKTSGRDKLFRTIQYSSKSLRYILELNKIKSELLDKVKILENVTSTFRKMLRLGKFIDSLYSATASIHIKDRIRRYTITLARISNSLFLFCDHVFWMAKVGLIDGNISKWSRSANKWWLYSIALSLVRDVYEIWKILDYEYNFKLNSDCLKIICKTDVLIKFCSEHKDIALDTFKNTCDVFLPLSSLEYININPFLIGVFGTLSSIAGIIAILNPLYTIPSS